MSSQDMEAKLAAYVEDLLDPADRAAIEQHLASNPEHRALLEELRGDRGLLRGLPRAAAPPEILEALQGQLERAVLLGDVDDSGAADAMRISRRGQFRAIAAVLLLATGLGAAIWWLLPSAGGKPELADIRTLPTAQPSPPGSRFPGVEDEFALKVSPKSPASAPGVVEFVEAAAGAPARRALSEQEIRARSALAAAAPDTDHDIASNALPAGKTLLRDAVVDQLKKQSQQPSVILVSSDNPAKTLGEVRGYLQQSGIAFEENANRADAPASAQLAGESKSEADGKASVAQQMDRANFESSQARSQSQRAEQSILARQVSASNVQKLRTVLGSPVQVFEKDKEQNKPAADAALDFGGAGGGRLGSVTPTTTFAGAIEALPTTMPRTIQAGDVLNIQIPQLQGPGVEPNVTARVDAAGAVQLPMLDPIPASGRTIQELSEQISQQYRQNHLIDQATPMISIAPTIAPTTAPTIGPTTQSSNEFFSLASPTTGPSEAEELVDVLIVVAPTTAPASESPTTSPTTEPIAEPTTAPTSRPLD